MAAKPLVAVLDACVLFPFTLRDTLLRAAADDLLQVRWSGEILDEMERSLVVAGTMPAAKAARLRTLMEEHFPEARIEGFGPLIRKMRNHPKDRHVVAAAVKCKAQIIVTSNLEHFGAVPAGIEAVSPDTFLAGFFKVDPDGVVDLLRRQAADLDRPPMTLGERVDRLARSVPVFSRRVRAHRLTGRSGGVEVVKRLATTSTVVARKPQDSNAVNAAGEWRPAMDHVGIEVHKRESRLCILNLEGGVAEARISTTRERFRVREIQAVFRVG